MTSEFIIAAHISEVPSGGQLRVEFPDQEILICNVAGEYFAIDYYCSHDALGLEGGIIENDCITCPYHGAEFCLRSGKVMASPAWQDIRVYPVIVEDDLIKLCIKPA